jgi:RNA polymerase sigma factor (sigma-70 family)
MSSANTSPVLRFLRDLRDEGPGEGSDARLLARFVAGRDEPAFGALVRRHGPMVYSVCRRVLGHAHDAEDAFQATFLVLARQAGSIRKPASLASWLYGVAFRVARKARSVGSRRQLRESLATSVTAAAPVPEGSSLPEAAWRELWDILDEELHRLPEKYRTPLVLCYLEGRTNEAAAKHLGCTKGTISSRLARARHIMRRRLSRRGLMPFGGLLIGLFGANTAPAAVPAMLMHGTVQAAIPFAAKQLAPGISTAAATLAQGMLRTMFFTKCTVTLTLVLVLSLVAIGGAVLPGALTTESDVPLEGAAVQVAMNATAAMPSRSESSRTGSAAYRQEIPLPPRNGIPPDDQQSDEGTTAFLFADPLAERDTEAPPSADTKKPDKGETLHYSGKVTDMETGKPIAGAVVTVRRSLYGDPEVKEEDRLVEETKHTTDATGTYRFIIPPEQSSKRYLYIELDAEHPEYAPRKRFGYALGMIRKNEKMGGRPFFEHVQLWPGKAITGVILTADGKPAAGVRVLSYSNTEKRKPNEFEYGSFADACTDASGRFRLTLITPGPAAFWILPDEYAPSTHGLLNNRRGDLGTFTLQTGIRIRGKVLDVRGKPLAGVIINARSRDRNEALAGLAVADSRNRSAVSDEKGEFQMRPLPPGTYDVQPGRYAEDSSGKPLRRPVPGVFIPQRLMLKADTGPLEIRAVPHVLIEAQYLDGKGKQSRGHECHIFGRMDKQFWFGEGKPDKNGKIVAQVPHGLEDVRIHLATNEHGVLRWRLKKGDPLNNAHEIKLGTVNDDVKGIELFHYKAPVLVIDGVDKDKRQVKGFKAQVVYGSGKSPKEKNSFFVNGVQGDVYLEKQEDGRWRSSQLLPDEDITVTVRAEGYQPRSTKLRLPEAEIRELELVLVLEK